MRTNSDCILREIAGEMILVTTGETAKNIGGLINLNDTAAFIWKNIDSVADTAELTERVLERFDIDRETASQDVEGLVKELIQIGMVIAD